jgi:phosphoribosylamine--glycine ligase
VTPDIAAFAGQRVAQAVVDGMRDEGEPYVGFLYVSLMLTPHGPKVIEFNVRFGDPEAQVVLPGLDGPIARVLAAAADGALDRAPALRVNDDRYVGVVLASRGYPASSESGRPIDGLERAAAVPDALVFHAGTAMADGRVVTAGGRDLTVVGRGPSYADAMATAYRAVSEISFDGMQYRRDIGRKAIGS